MCLRKILLACGIIASLLYVGTDLLAGTLYLGYSFIDQAISELFAIGAPTSSLTIPLFTLYDVLIISFALGVWASAGRSRPLRIISLVTIAGAINGLLLWNVFPMHMRGSEMGFTDVMHVALAGMGVVFVLMALVFGISAFERRFRLYTMATILAVLVPGLIVFIYAPQVSINLPTHWLGLTERISTYVYLLWQAVLAIVLLRAEKSTRTIGTSDVLQDSVEVSTA